MAMKHPEIINAEASKRYTYLALGDSYTIGEKVSTAENFPNQVAMILREANIDFRSPRIVAKTGWTTDELQTAIKKTRLQRHYDFVTLLIGVNDQYRGKKVVEYIPRFEALLKQALSLANNDTSRVVVLSIPDWSVTPFAEGRDRAAIAKEINDYNAANQLIAQQYHIPYLYITESTRRAATDDTLLAQDGLHPSGKEYAKWAREVASLFRKSLKQAK